MAGVYRPRHQRQLFSDDPNGAVNCLAYATAIALDRATIGGLVGVTGALIRRLTDEPVPDRDPRTPNGPGLIIEQIIPASAKLHVMLTSRVDRTWTTLMADLRAWRGVVVETDYDQFGVWSAQPSFRGDHGVFINHISSDGKLLVYDPLAAKARWIPESVIRTAAEKRGRNAGLAAGRIRYAVTRPTPLIA